MKTIARWLVCVIGLALLVVSVREIIVGTSSAGAIALIIAGSVLVISPFILDRIEQLSVSTTGLELRLSREISDLGAPRTAQILERTELATFAESYAFIYEELRDPKYLEVRTYLQDRLVECAAAVARRQKFDPSEVRTLFKNGSPMMRVLTLGLMEGDQSLADDATILSAVGDSRSGNEQYHGLKLATLCWPKLPKSTRQTLKSLVRESPYIQQDADRQQLAQQLLNLPDS
jgi:hypothetical protein